MSRTAPRPVVVITGGSGLIGRALAARLAPTHTVVTCDVVPAEQARGVDYVPMDVTDDASVRDALALIRRRHGERIASVVHLAAYYDFTGEESPGYDEVTVRGTRRLLKALPELSVEQLVFTSTMLVHAAVSPGERIQETSPIEARWAYPRSKIGTERVLRASHLSARLLILRLAGIYDDDGRQPTLVQQIRRIHQRDLTSFLFPGDTGTGQSLVHLDDAVDALVRGIARRRELPQELTLLIGEPDPPSYAELQDRIGELLWGREWPTLRVPETVAKAGAWVQDHTPGTDPFIKPFMIDLADDHYALDIGRARRFLGWEPKHRLLDALPRIIGPLQANPVGWYEANDLEVPDSLSNAAR